MPSATPKMPSVSLWRTGNGAAVIPAKSDQSRWPSFDKAAYRERNQVERSVNR